MNNRIDRHTFKLRILTALILIPLAVAALFFLSQPMFAGVCTLLAGLAAWEWAGFLGWEKASWRALYVVFILIGILIALLFPPLLVISVGSFYWFLIFLFLAYLIFRQRLVIIPKWLIGIAGFFVLVPAWEAFVVLHLMVNFLLYMLVVVWVSDTMAYLGGFLWGKRKLAPLISPNKTYEGAITAFLAIGLLAVGAQWLWGEVDQPMLGWIVLTASTFFAGVTGDLFESLLKRQAQLKDTSQLLPGHGGWLDRIDSLLAAAPVFASGLIVLRLHV